MKNFLLFPIIALAVIFSPRSLAGQHTERTRDVKILILDKKEKPMPGVVVRAVSDSVSYVTDPAGKFVFKNVKYGDTVEVILAKNKLVIPTVATDSFIVRLTRRPLLHLFENNLERQVELGYTSIVERNRTTAATTLNVEEILSRKNANTLAELLDGEVPGFTLTVGSVFGEPATGNIRNRISVTGGKLDPWLSSMG